MARSKETYVSSTDNECEICCASIWEGESFGYLDGILACFFCWADDDDDDVDEDWEFRGRW